MQPSGPASLRHLRDTFTRLYGGSPRIFRAPGRVNLIGEHTDYSDGFVMPAAIGFYTYVAVGPRNDRKLSVHSINFGDAKQFDLQHISEGPTGHWSDYVRGVASVLQSKGGPLPGANLLIQGDVPVGAGLSSSAAIEVASALALLDNSGVALDRLEVALACQQAEHVYAGTNCGIMDQFISCFGQANHALRLDCRSLVHQSLEIDSKVRIVICNTKVKHELASGEYNLRRSECEAGVRYLKRHLPEIRALRDVDLEELNRWGTGMPEETYRRCRHVVTENERVQAATEALESADLHRFGELMAESQRSLRDDFEVSCKELDLMVKLAESSRGVYGARLTGGGFGGSTVNLVRADAAKKFKQTIEREYQHATGVRPDVYVCCAAEGAGEVRDTAT